MPSAPPSSTAVSEIPEAAPARSGGAEPDDEIRRQREDRCEAEGDHDRGGDDDRQAVRRRRPASAGRGPTAASTSAAPMTLAGRKRRTSGGARFDPTMNPMAEGTEHRPATQRGQADDQLEVLRDEQEIADGHEDRQEVHDQRGVEGRDPEQAQVDHRVVGVQLPADPEDTDDDADRDRGDGQGARRRPARSA